jgi:glycosyltransferase involved in cell wall biosynthesis
VNYLFYVPQMAAYGGMERHVCDLAIEARRRGHAVRLLTTSNSLNPEARGELRSAGVDFRELSAQRDTAGKFAKAFWLWRQTLAARFQPWDLIYTNGQSALASVVWRAGRGSARMVHHHHTAGDPAEQQTWSQGFRDVLARAGEIVACSDATRAHLETATGRKDVRFLPYFTLCPVRGEEVVERNHVATRPLQIGFIGRLVATKGVATLCELSQRPELADVRWQIHGTGDEFPESYFKAFPNVSYRGRYRDQAQYAQILRDLDAIALYTKHNEGMPLSLIEAMSAGLPWVASDRGGTRELARTATDAVIIDDPHDPSAVLGATVELVNRIRAGRTSRKAQRAAYDRHFAREVVARRWFDYFESRPGPVQPVS